MKVSDKYIQEVLSLHKRLHHEMIRKDLILSYILQELSTLPDLVFKGGTCLTKCYLNYHRLSEDLDFLLQVPTTLTKTARKAYIRKYFKTEFLPLLVSLSHIYNLDFEGDEFSTQGKRYCPVKNADDVFIFNVYNSKEDTNPIKIEVNVSETLFSPIERKSTKNLCSFSNHIPFPLKEVTLSCYSLHEIILEKIRALLTRPQGILERDVFDLFLIHSQQNVFSTSPKKILLKLQNSFLYNKKNVTQRIESFDDYKLFHEIDDMALHDFDEQAYRIFAYELFVFIKKLF